MNTAQQLICIGFRKKFNQRNFNTEAERQEYVNTAVELGKELNLEVKPIEWRYHSGKIYRLAGWIIDGREEMDELFL